MLGNVLNVKSLQWQRACREEAPWIAVEGGGTEPAPPGDPNAHRVFYKTLVVGPTRKCSHLHKNSRRSGLGGVQVLWPRAHGLWV